VRYFLRVVLPFFCCMRFPSQVVTSHVQTRHLSPSPRVLRVKILFILFIFVGGAQRLARCVTSICTSRLTSKFLNLCVFNFSILIGTVSTVAGSDRGMKNGTKEGAKFHHPNGLCFNPVDKCLYVCDTDNKAIRKVTAQGIKKESIEENCWKKERN
jgi:hypothetical protein